MDLPSKNMYDTFKDEIWKDLGPLNPNWFEVLSAQTPADEGITSDQEDLCANQEANFKTTLDKTSVESQLFSTPKVFRHAQLLSPQTEDERSFSTEQESEILPWAAIQSPHLFEKKGVSDGRYGGIQPRSESSFDIPHTPHKSPISYAKLISESLGAQIDPDISWTSSLNTPPAVSSTLILSKHEGSPCPASISEEQNVIFVRKLFPSLSNPPTVRITSLNNDDVPPVCQGALFPVEECVESSESSYDQSDGVWQQKLPDAFEDGEIQRTAAGVLDGAANVLSGLFADSNSTLRKEKPDKIERKQCVQTKGHNSSANIASTNSPESRKDKSAHEKPDSFSSASQVQAADSGMSQWSPLSLSDIPACVVDNNKSPKQSQSNSDAGNIIKPPAKVLTPGFIKKKRTFVYNVGPLKSQVQRKEAQSQKMDSPLPMLDSGQGMNVLLRKAQAHCPTTEKIVQKQEDVAQENLALPLQGKVQDVDMSQLCREFAQDFSQMSDSEKTRKVTEETQSHFSPSVCLSAMKQAKQKMSCKNLHPDSDGVGDEKLVSLTSHNHSMIEGTTTDSGFQSAVTDITPMTASLLNPPCSENRDEWCFKADICGTFPFTCTNKRIENGNMDPDAETKLCGGLKTQLMETQTLELERKPERESECKSTQLSSRAGGSVDNINCIPLNGNVHGSLPETTANSQTPVHTSGFKTASDKGIHISSANLKRAKLLFEETECEGTSDRQQTKSGSARKHNTCRSNKSAKFTMSNSNPLPTLDGCKEVSCQLTASQKADVTELCSLLEEANSQFEFTQFKTEKTKLQFQGDATSPSKAEKELDPDFLTDIDFDDSFTSDAEKPLIMTGTPEKAVSVADRSNCGTSNAPKTSSSMSNPLKNIFSYDPDGPSSSVCMSDESTGLIQPKYLHKVEHNEQKEVGSKNPLTLGVAFKSAGGNLLRVSKAGLSKAKALFVNLEEKLSNLKSPDKQEEVDAGTKQKCITDSLTGEQNLAAALKCDSNVEERDQGSSSDTIEHFFSNTEAIRMKDKDANKNVKNSKVCQSGFHMASGKSIAISAEYMQLADAFFKDSDQMGLDDNMSVKKRKRIESVAKCTEKHASGYSNFGKVNAALITQHRTEPPRDAKEMSSVGSNGTLALENAVSLRENPFSTSKPVSFPSCTTSKDIDSSAIDGLSQVDGFCTASGKKVTVSTDSMKRAEYLLKEHYPPQNTKTQCRRREDTVKTGHLSAPVQVPIPKTGGFQTTSCGKEIAISPAALQKQKLLNECYESQFQMPLHGSAHRDGGFVSASGKPVALSSEALQKAKALFSDISLSADVEAMSHTKTSDKNQSSGGKNEKVRSLLKTGGYQKVQEAQKVPVKHTKNRNAMNGNTIEKTNSSDLKPDQRVIANKSEEPGNGRIIDTNKQVKQKVKSLAPQNSGFQTASGKAVTVSSKALKKGKALLSGCEELEDKIGSIQTHGHSLKNDGFLEASGKTVAVSSKAQRPDHASDISLSSDIPAVSDTKQDKLEKTQEIHCGFTTARGEKVHVSEKNLLKAKSLLENWDESVSKDVKPKTDGFNKNSDMNSKNRTPFNDQKIERSVIVSSGDEKNISELKSDQRGNKNLSEEHEMESTENTNTHLKRNVLHSKRAGFQTASGKGVRISSEALKRAKTLLGECEEVKDQISTTQSCFKVPAPVLPPRNRGFLASSRKQVTVCSEDLQRTKAPLYDINLSVAASAISDTGTNAKKQGDRENSEETLFGFETAEENVHVSQENLSEKTLLLKNFVAMQREDVVTKDCDVDSDDKTLLKPNDNELHGTTSRSKKKNYSELEPHQPLITNVFQEPANGSEEVVNKPLKQVSETLPGQNGGFQTASGRRVTISSEALKQAKTLLNEAEEVEDNIDTTVPHFKVPIPPSRKCGFQAASGKQVSVSTEALQKAKVIFGDISLSPAVAGRRMDKKMPNNGEDTKEMHCGFTTAGGQKVHLSQRGLIKANNLLKEFADETCHDSSSNALHNTLKFESLKNKFVKRPSTSYHSRSSEKVLFSDASASLVDKCFTPVHGTDCEEETIESFGGCSQTQDEACMGTSQFQDKMGDRHHNPEQEMPCVLDNEGSRTSKECKVSRGDDDSLLNFWSLHLTGCTKTQEDFLAQEALDCTKALLEDEGLAGHSLSLTSQHMPLRESPNRRDRSEVENKRTGKRATMDESVAGQPPLKRQLLEEFDSTVDRSRDSTLRPMKTCSHGDLKDRGVFKYSPSLRPNITRPHWNGNNCMETKNRTQTSNSGHVTPSNTKLPVFVPPFIKNAKMEACRNLVLRDKTKTPAFVPPFKKQRTLVQEMSSKLLEEDKDTQPHLLAKPSNSGTFVPPAKKTKVPTEVTAIAETTSDTTMNNQDLSVDCGAASLDTESSGVDHTISTSQGADLDQNLDSIVLARDMQDMRIRKKKRQTTRPVPGSLFLTKTSGIPRIPLKVAMKGKHPVKFTPKQLYGYGVHKQVSKITSENAESFRFNMLQFIKKETIAEEGGVQLGDGGWLIPSNDCTAGKEEFYRGICDTPGVDPKLISEAWVYNHYRWIVWKQASMERSFPETTGSLCLTPEQVLLQLKYRYDVEVDSSHRPALRKIMEQDDTAAKTLVLCVCGIVSLARASNKQSPNDSKAPQGADAKVETPPAVVWLTDGWYAIKAQLDDPLAAMLQKDRFAVGCKLMIHGAQLVGSQDACPPLEAPESLMLKICANSCRPARWDVKLGFYKDPRPFLLPVSSLYSNGGPVGCVDIVILRSYPIQWMERKPDGGVLFRSGRAEEKEARRFNSNKQKALEILIAKIQAEFEREENGKNKPQRRRRSVNYQDITRLQDGEELYEAVGEDPAYLQAHLSEQQLATLQTYRRSVMEKKQAELQNRYRLALEAEDNETSPFKRDVTPVWRLCIADSQDQPGNVYQLNLWRPTSDLQSILKEGCRCKVYNLTTSEGKKRSGIENFQLTGTKKTQFQDLQISQEWLSARFQPRVSASFVSLQNADFQPLCGEVDLTGFVISVINGQGSSPAFYLADGKQNFVKVRCFSSLSQSGLEDVVKPGALLALSNLQLRGQSMFPTPVVFAGDLNVVSTNPKEVHLQESLNELKSLIQSQENFLQTAEEKLSHLVSCGELTSFSPALQPQTPTPTTDRRQDTKTRVTPQMLVRSLGSFTPVSRNPSTAATSSTEKDPKGLKRKRALDYLSRIPSPPPLSHLGSVVSPCLNKTFNTPRRSGTPSTSKTVQTPAPKPTESLKAKEWVNDEELAMIDTQLLH